MMAFLPQAKRQQILALLAVVVGESVVGVHQLVALAVFVYHAFALSAFQLLAQNAFDLLFLWGSAPFGYCLLLEMVLVDYQLVALLTQ